MFPALDISTSALVAQRVRLDAVSSNLANLSTPGYKALDVDFDETLDQQVGGVQEAEIAGRPLQLLDAGLRDSLPAVPGGVCVAKLRHPGNL